MASTIAGMSKEAPPSRTAPQFVVRMPDDEFRNRIAEAAKNNNRSMNAEILARLEESFRRTSDVVTKEELSDLFDKWRTRQESELVAVMSVRTMLANNVVRMFEQLPPERRTEAFSNAYDFAYALTSSDGKGLEDAVAKILGEDPNGRAAKLAASGLREQETGYRLAASKMTKK